MSVLPCLSRIPVQRPGAGDGGRPGPGSAAAAPRGGGCQLLLPTSLRPADVYHTHALQQENGHQRQGQRHGGGQGCLPVSVFALQYTPLSSVTEGFDLQSGCVSVCQVIHACGESICCGCILMLVGDVGSFWQLLLLHYNFELFLFYFLFYFQIKYFCAQFEKQVK